MSEVVLFTVDRRAVVLTLNRPEKLNALNYETIDRLLSLLDDIEVSNDIDAVILTGAGNEAFSAGGDIVEFAGSVEKGGNTPIRDFVRRGQALTARIEAFPKPIIVAVNGLAFGGGCEVTEAAHLAIAVDEAAFAKPEIKLGMPPTFGGTQRLPRLAGRKRALELLLTGDTFSATKALELGLINAIVRSEDLMPAAHALAGRITRHNGSAVRSIITAVTRGLNMGIAEGLLSESEQFAALVPTDDLRSGLAAWIGRKSASETLRA